MRIVLDTNILFPALSPKHRHHIILEHTFSETFQLLISTPILLEYEEILTRVFQKNVLEQFWLFIATSESVVFVNPTFSFQIPVADEDDQKFVDCAVCGNADYLITNDKHFNLLKEIDFPKLTVVSADAFLKMPWNL
jgi:putative PIN family toxin of toxin-antitoxin system